MTRSWLRWLALMVACSGCKGASGSLDGFACGGDGQCTVGFVCHPETQLCTRPVPVSCSGDGYCPSSVVTGDPCPWQGSFLPCQNAVEDCSRGCRTCSPSLTWGACSPGECVPTGPEACNGLDDDCDGTPDNIESADLLTECLTRHPLSARVQAWSCATDAACVIGACEEGYRDSNGDVADGCEYACTETGPEICDGIDNDCDGDIDLLPDVGAACSTQEPEAEHVAVWACVQASCVIETCEPGWVNEGGGIEDGCESMCTPTEPPDEVCDGTDNDCDGVADNANAAGCTDFYADADQDGLGNPNDVLCLCAPGPLHSATVAEDCDDGAATCTDVCVDTDGDDISDCRDNCLDVDGDGYGLDGGGGACLGSDCDDGNQLCAVNCITCCQPSDTFRVANETLLCGEGTTDVPVMRLVLSTDCPNTLTRLRVSLHPTSNTPPTGGVVNARLYYDEERDGLDLQSDPLVDGPIDLVNGRLDFDKLLFPVTGEQTEVLYLVVDGDPSQASYFAVQVNSADDFSVGDPGQGKELGSTPLRSGVHNLGSRLCDGSEEGEPQDLGPGSQAAASARRLVGPNDSMLWSGGAGDETDWIAGPLRTPPAIADCNLQTSANGTMEVSDAGARSSFLHIDTGVPLQLPLCADMPLTMRVVASEYSRTSESCTHDLLADHKLLRVFSYETATQVAQDSEIVFEMAAKEGPTTAAGCRSDFVDLSLAETYRGASGTPNLELRLVVDADGDVDSDGSTRINTIGELYLDLGSVGSELGIE